MIFGKELVMETEKGLMKGIGKGQAMVKSSLLALEQRKEALSVLATTLLMELAIRNRRGM